MVWVWPKGNLLNKKDYHFLSITVVDKIAFHLA